MLASSAARPGWTTSEHSNPALVASRHARSRASIPNGRAGLLPIGTKRRGVSVAMAARIKARCGAGKGRTRSSLAQNYHFAHQSAGMAEVTDQETDQRHGSVYRVAGAI